MKSEHRIYFEDSHRMTALADQSVDLVVTSPPYPMIQMWDDLFVKQNPEIGNALEKKQGWIAFELMHQVLDGVWQEIDRVLKIGGLACINIGDATRTIGDEFVLYPSHSRILAAFLKQGFSSLPAILWRKPTNAPNKFMGSGMLPAGAYVTLEHEFLLLFRKGKKRSFLTRQEIEKRQQSAFFWEERNQWFSDVWFNLPGIGQNLMTANGRHRSAAFPFEIPYRIICMFSVKGDVVLDPFLGLGTTMFAAMTAGRNSIGYELDATLGDLIRKQTQTIVSVANSRIKERLKQHLAFIQERQHQQKPINHRNQIYGFPVMTRQEKMLFINQLTAMKQIESDRFEVTYADEPQAEFCCEDAEKVASKEVKSTRRIPKQGKTVTQMRMFDATED